MKRTASAISAGPDYAVKSAKILKINQQKIQVLEGRSLLVFEHNKKQMGNKIAGFDMDWTLIRTKSGSTFAKNAFDWDFLYPQVL